MPWQDRVVPAELVTPDGKLYFLEFEDVSSEGTNKTSQWVFASESIALVQNEGIGLYKTPFKAFISGDDYDITAADFDVSLGLKGNSVLTHPMYGVITVVVESWKRTDALATNGNQAAYTLTLTQTIAEEEQAEVTAAATEVQAAIDEAAIINGDIAAESLYDVKKPGLLANAAARIKEGLSKFRAAVNKILDKAAQVRAAVETAIATIEGNLDLFLAAPALLFSAISSLVKLPGRIKARIGDKIKAFRDLIRSYTRKKISGTGADAKNERIEAQVWTAAYTAAAADSYLYASENSAATAQALGATNDAVVESLESGVGFTTRAEATAAAVALVNEFRLVQEKNDQEQRTSESSPLSSRFYASDRVNQSQTSIVLGTARILLGLAFQLRQEREITLLNDITPIELCYQLYGTTRPNTLDFFIGTNAFVDEDFFMLRKGRAIRYYV